MNQQISVEWSETLGHIQVQPFTETRGPVHHLANATPTGLYRTALGSFFDLLADETSQYSQLKQVSRPNPKWYPMTPEEMKAFIGVNILMGIDPKPEIASYWSTDEFLRNVGIQRLFPRDRSEHLTR